MVGSRRRIWIGHLLDYKKSRNGAREHHLNGACIEVLGFVRFGRFHGTGAPSDGFRRIRGRLCAVPAENSGMSFSLLQRPTSAEPAGVGKYWTKRIPVGEAKARPYRAYASA